MISINISDLPLYLKRDILDLDVHTQFPRAWMRVSGARVRALRTRNRVRAPRTGAG